MVFSKNSTVLERYHSGWAILPTKVVGAITNVYYSATTPGFSVYAITAVQPSKLKPDSGIHVIYNFWNLYDIHTYSNNKEDTWFRGSIRYYRADCSGVPAEKEKLMISYSILFLNKI